MFVTLKAKSNKGKNRLAQHGDRWQVIEDRPTEIVVQSFGKTLRGFGPSEPKEHDIRRVLKKDDPHFDIEGL